MKKRDTTLEERLMARLKNQGLVDQGEQRELDPTLAKEFKGVLGRDTDTVRIHTGPEAARLTQSMNAKALAFSTGDIYFAPDQYMPNTAEGKALLAHELTHVADGELGASGVPLDDQRREGEIRARMVEKMVLARERFRKQPQQQVHEPQKLQLEKNANTPADAQPPQVTIDKAALEEKTYEILQRMIKLEQERNGRY